MKTFQIEIAIIACTNLLCFASFIGYRKTKASLIIGTVILLIVLYNLFK